MSAGAALAAGAPRRLLLRHRRARRRAALRRPSLPAPRCSSSARAPPSASAPPARDRRWTTLLARAAGWREWNEGLPGSTLTDGAGPLGVPSAESRLLALPRRHAPAAVVVMYGANDVWRGVPVGEVGQPGTFRNAAAVVLRGLRAAFPRAVLVVCTPQPCRRLSAARAPYDEALAAEAARVGAVLVRGGAAFPDEEIAALLGGRDPPERSRARWRSPRTWPARSPRPG